MQLDINLRVTQFLGGVLLERRFLGRKRGECQMLCEEILLLVLEEHEAREEVVLLLDVFLNALGEFDDIFDCRGSEVRVFFQFFAHDPQSGRRHQIMDALVGNVFKFPINMDLARGQATKPRGRLTQKIPEF
jgi:hypothetical protein